MSKIEVVTNPAALHADAYVVDLLMPWLDYGSYDLRVGVLSRLSASGYTYISLTLALDGYGVQETLDAIAHERRFFLSQPDRFILVEGVDDIVRAKREKKLAIGFNFQGTEPVGRNLDMVDVYCHLGVRQMLMAYNQKNAVGDGCHELTDCGLSRFGRKLVERMNQVGVLVDVSHTGFRTAMDVMEVSSKPVIFSHSNPHELYLHGRNITVEQAKACAATGGVVGINGCGMFVQDNDVSAEALFRLIDKHVQSVGTDHVGIGLDYLYDLPAWLDLVQSPESASRYPDDGDYRRMDVRFSDPEELPRLTNVLLDKGYAEADVRKILGENWLRVMRAVWA